MSNKYNLSPTERLNYVHKGKLSTSQKMKFIKQFFFTFALISFLVLILIPYFSRYKKQQALEEEIELAKKEVAKYEKKTQELSELISYLDSDQAIEERARMNFGLKKEGETVVVIKRPQESKNDENKDGLLENNKSISSFKKWYNYFFNN